MVEVAAASAAAVRSCSVGSVVVVVVVEFRRRRGLRTELVEGRRGWMVVVVGVVAREKTEERKGCMARRKWRGDMVI